MKQNKGFSLVELIIVIAIMAILAAAIAPALIRYIDKSRKSDDIEVCGVVGEAVLLTINSGDADDGTGVDKDMYELWCTNSSTNTRYSVSVDGGAAYQVECVAYWQNGATSDEFVNGGDSDFQPCVDSVNLNVGTPQSKMLKFTKGPSNNVLDTIYVMKHVATSEIEVWVGYGGGGSGGNPLYELYPEQCSDYK